MRKIFSLFAALMLAVLFASPIFAASITVSIFPVYDWAREISKGVSNDITILLDSGADLHSYQPSAEDIVRISESDLFVYVGGESAHEHHEHEEHDEHIWLSLRNAEKICRKLAETLSEIDPSHKNIYDSNAETYAGKLS